MYIAKVDREQFLSFLAGKTLPPVVASKINDLSSKNFGNELYLTWLNKPKSTNDLPYAIVLSEKQRRDFLAWANTYIGSYKPFTSFFRVITPEIFESVRNQKYIEYQESIVRALVSIIMAEASYQIGNTKSLEEISIQACLGTASYALAQGILAGYPSFVLKTIGTNWEKTRSHISHEKLKLDYAIVIEFWEKLSLLLNGCSSNKIPIESPLSALLNILYLPVEIGNREIGDFLQEVARHTKDSETSKSNKEAQVLWFEDALQQLLLSDIEKNIKEFLAGYLYSELAAGSLAYLNIAIAYFERSLPGAILWFGFFLALKEKNDIYSVGNCLGRKIRKKLIRNFEPTSIINADIAFSELELLHSAKNLTPNFRTDYSSQISVELYPNIVGKFNYKAFQKTPEIDKSLFLAEGDISEIQYSLHRISKILSKVGDSKQQDMLGKYLGYFKPKT